MSDRFELLVTDKATGRSEVHTFPQEEAAQRYAARYMPTRGDRNFRLTIRDKGRDYKDGIVFSWE